MGFLSVDGIVNSKLHSVSWIQCQLAQNVCERVDLG
jgi:hypothetical protein